MTDYFLAIDQGTTSSRAIVFDQSGRQKGVHQMEYPQIFPKDGWVEQNPEDIWKTTLTCCRQVIPQSGLRPEEIKAIGISNQRETTIVWERATGKPIANAISWMDRRTADYCATLRKDSKIARMISEKTGLVLDPYFSATKLHWILENIPDARKKAEQGELLFGTVDCYLLWKLTKGEVHATDATNASRTMLFNIHTQVWDEDLLKLFNIPTSLLPEVKDSSGHFGDTENRILGTNIPITGIAGDQQAATVGQACFKRGMFKSTYGTGCFIMLNTGDQAISSQQHLLTTIAYRLKGKVTYALEGSIFAAGVSIQWLRDQMHFIRHAKDTEAMVQAIEDTGGVYFIPAFNGLGAPYWDPNARAAILGLNRDTSIPQIVRAALESVCFQTRDLLLAMQNDYPDINKAMRVDGGMVENDWLMQRLANLMGTLIERPKVIEISALGAAFLAALGVGTFSSITEIESQWVLDKAWDAETSEAQRQEAYAGWQGAVKRVLS